MWIKHDEKCAGCGMLPIVGPRYESTKEKGHSLCTFCHFNKKGDKNFKKYFKKFKWLVSLHLDMCYSGTAVDEAQKWAA